MTWILGHLPGLDSTMDVILHAGDGEEASNRSSVNSTQAIRQQQGTFRTESATRATGKMVSAAHRRGGAHDSFGSVSYGFPCPGLHFSRADGYVENTKKSEGAQG